MNIVKEVTGDPSFSMFNLSLKEDWSKTKKFCHSLHGKDQRNQTLDQARNHCGDDKIVETNGLSQLNNHRVKVHCEQNNHENHVQNRECHTTDKTTHSIANSNSNSNSNAPN